MMNKIIYNNSTQQSEIVEYNLKFEDMLTIEDEIFILKQQLANTDYQAIKYAEGELSEEEYMPIKEERKSWRARINELEQIINNI